MSMDRVHSLGDSWTCIEAGGENAGWQVYAGLRPEHRHGIPGSTAAQWAADEGGIWTQAAQTMKPGDIVFVSLIGNDFRRALADGILSPAELMGASTALRTVLDRIVAGGRRAVAMGYTNPWPENTMAATAAYSLCCLVRHIAKQAGATYFDTARHLVMPAHFDGADFHPTAAGHQALADAIRAEVEG